jgi:thermitase
MKRWIVLALASTLLLAGTISAPTATAKHDEHKRVLVRFASGATSADRADSYKKSDAEEVDKVYGDDVYVVKSKKNESDEQLADKLKKDKKVSYAEPDVALQIDVANPNDPSFGSQYALQKVNAVAGWTAYPGSYTSTGGVTIAMIDTGIDTTHPEFAGRIDTANSKCFGLTCVLTGYEDDNGHGTHTSGTAAAATNNATGVAGLSYNSKIQVLKVCNLAGSCQTADVVSAINWAKTHGAKVMSMSLGGGGTATMATAVQQAYAAGVVIVAAAGNDGNATLNYPAAYPEVISVAATDANDARASFSNANNDVEIAAPGVNVLSTYSGDGYSSLSGTSMATPHVAGLAALLRGQNPTWTAAQVRARMNACSDDLGAPGWDSAFGNGRINLGRALGAC